MRPDSLVPVSLTLLNYTQPNFHSTTQSNTAILCCRELISHSLPPACFLQNPPRHRGRRSHTTHLPPLISALRNKWGIGGQTRNFVLNSPGKDTKRHKEKGPCRDSLHAHVICTRRVDKTGVSGHHAFKNGRKCSLCKPHPSRCPQHVSVLWPRLSQCDGGWHWRRPQPPLHLPSREDHLAHPRPGTHSDWRAS